MAKVLFLLVSDDSAHRGVLSQHALQVVSQHALQQVSRGCICSGRVSAPGRLLRRVSAPGGVCSWGDVCSQGGVCSWGVCSGGCVNGLGGCGLLLWPSGLMAFWFGGLLVESGLLVWWPSG